MEKEIVWGEVVRTTIVYMCKETPTFWQKIKCILTGKFKILKKGERIRITGEGWWS